MACENCGGCKCTVTVKDNDGHAYRIPADRENEFQAALARASLLAQGSTAWHEAHAALDNAFGSYLIG